MASPRKLELLEGIKSLLAEKKDFVVITYAGLNVEQISGVRRAIRKSNGQVKVLKNNLFRRALRESAEHQGMADSIDNELHGPIAVSFTKSDMPSMSKLLVNFSKELEPITIKAGCMDGKYLDKNEVNQIATLPSREELLTIIGRGLNTPAQKIAIGMNEIIAGVARGIKAIGEKNG